MILLQAGDTSIMDSWWQAIKHADQGFFLLINRDCASDFLDKACLAWREPKTWIPLYLFLLVFSIWKLKKRSWIWILVLIVTVSLLDQISSTFIKNWVGRVRPCGDAEFSHLVRLVLGRCPTSGSFTSSHAANHFGAAVFISYTLKPYLKQWRRLFYIWAFTISFSQVYVGVHYPLDVIGGAALGLLLGYIASILYRRIADQSTVHTRT